MSDWSEALREAVASAPADTVVIEGLELIHPQFVDHEGQQDSIRVALDGQRWRLTHEAGAPLFGGLAKWYEPLDMTIKLPEQTENTGGTLDMSIDNVPRGIWPYLQRAAKVRASAMVIFRQWVAERDLETGQYTVSGPPDMIYDQLTMKMVKATQLRITGSAGFVDVLNKSFPRATFDRDQFPGLHGVST